MSPKIVCAATHSVLSIEERSFTVHYAVWFHAPSSVITTRTPAFGDCAWTPPRNTSVTWVSSLSDRHQATDWPVIVNVQWLLWLTTATINWWHVHLLHTHQAPVDWWVRSHMSWFCEYCQCKEFWRQNGRIGLVETVSAELAGMTLLVCSFLIYLQCFVAYRKEQDYAFSACSSLTIIETDWESFSCRIMHLW